MHIRDRWRVLKRTHKREGGVNKLISVFELF